jgi:hypothetical protein
MLSWRDLSAAVVIDAAEQAPHPRAGPAQAAVD